MPLNDQLLQIKRTSETNWTMKHLLPVSFASLIQPPQNSQDLVQICKLIFNLKEYFNLMCYFVYLLNRQME